MRVEVQSAPFDFGAEAEAFAQASEGAGAVVTFSGIVRDVDGSLVQMDIEHYPGMTEKALREIAQTARSRWDLGNVLVIHRHGALRPGDMIMMVATAARHRVAAFEAAEFLMDYLKSRAPFWKREVTREGANWVEAKSDDEAALSRWDT
jgi:molybdopterin synthase catalytic subunit